MTPLTEGFKLWVRGVVVNAGMMTFIAIHGPGLTVFSIAVFVASLLLGLIISSPLIIVVSLLVKIFVQHPSPAVDKFAWLLFALALTAGGFDALLVWLLPVTPIMLLLVIGGSIPAAVIAGFWSKSSLIQLNDTQHEQHLV